MKLLVLLIILFSFGCTKAPVTSDWQYHGRMSQSENGCIKIYDKDQVLVFDECDPELKFPE